MNKRILKNLVIVALLGTTAGLGYANVQANETNKQQEESIQLKDKSLESKTTSLAKIEKDKKKTEEDLAELTSKKEELEKVNKEDKEKVVVLETEIEALKQDLKIKREKEQEQAKAKEKVIATTTDSKPTENTEEAKQVTVEATPEPKKEETPSPEPKEETTADTSGSGVDFVATYYAVNDGYTPGTVTANGTDVSNTIYTKEGHRIIAVDPNVIPMNSIVKITVNGESFTAKASDTGSAIVGNRIDILIDNPQKANDLGYNDVKVEILG